MKLPIDSKTLTSGTFWRRSPINNARLNNLQNQAVVFNLGFNP